MGVLLWFINQQLTGGDPSCKHSKVEFFSPIWYWASRLEATEPQEIRAFWCIAPDVPSTKINPSHSQPYKVCPWKQYLEECGFLKVPIIIIMICTLCYLKDKQTNSVCQLINSYDTGGTSVDGLKRWFYGLRLSKASPQAADLSQRQHPKARRSRPFAGRWSR